MPIISYIPKRYQEGFKKMSLIKTEVFEAIQEGLSYTSLVSSITVLSEKVAKIKNIDGNELKEIFLSAGSLISFLNKEGILEEIVEEISSLAIANKLIDPKNSDTLKKILSFLLSNQQIYYASKANSLITEYGNVFIQARIVTDLRPIFGVNVEDAPKAGMIVHNLHIHYQSEIEGNHKDFYIALDSKDIKNLKDALIRAEKKESSLQFLYDKTGMANLNE